MLSVQTNTAALNAVNALDKANRSQVQAATRLSTGYRVNSAADDAAGLQIASRLAAQASGTQVAMRNIQKGLAFVNVVDSFADGYINLFLRMRDLAVQAGDASATQEDRKAMQGEFEQMYEEVQSRLDTNYAGERLVWFDAALVEGKLHEPMQFQTGAGSADVLNVDVSDQAWQAVGASLPYDYYSLTSALVSHSSQTIGEMERAISEWSKLRSMIGAVGNRLEHAFNNATNLLANTQAAHGRIVDTDYATETAQSTVQQMLAQSSAAMLKQSSRLTDLALSLIG